MKDLEKQIEEAANNYCENFSHDYLWQQTNVVTFKRGVKSPEAKEYWQQGMYTEEEVKILIRAYAKEFFCQDWCLGDERWFEQNKKK